MRSIRGLPAGLAGCALLAGCGGSAASHMIAPEKTAKAASDGLTGMVAAFNARDLAKDIAYDAPDVVIIQPGIANVIGAEADRASSRAAFADPLNHLEVSDTVIDTAGSGEFAVTRSLYAYTSTDPATKAKKVEVGNLVTQWKVQPDASVKLALAVLSPMPAAALPAMKAELKRQSTLVPPPNFGDHLPPIDGASASPTGS